MIQKMSQNHTLRNIRKRLIKELVILYYSHRGSDNSDIERGLDITLDG